MHSHQNLQRRQTKRISRLRDKPEEALLRLLFAGLGGAGYVFLAAWLVKKAVDVVGNPFQIDLRKDS